MLLGMHIFTRCTIKFDKLIGQFISVFLSSHVIGIFIALQTK